MVEVHKVRNIGARQVCMELEEAGISAAPLLKEAGLQMYQINQEDGWVPYENYARLLEATARGVKDPYFGLNAASRTNPRDLGALAYVGLASKTLEEALQNCARYVKVQTEAWGLDIVVESKTVVVRFKPARAEFELYPQATEAAICFLVCAYQFFLTKPLTPIAVSFVHPIGSFRKNVQFERHLGCPVKFGQVHNQIILDRKLLSLPIGTADDRLLKILKAHCEQILKQNEHSRSDLVGRIMQTIIDRLSSGSAKAKHVATELGMSERTLHRRLSEEGTSFREIHEKLCTQLANKYIREKELSLQQVAFLLGYADQSAFGVAFKRWTGNTPKEIRASVH